MSSRANVKYKFTQRSLEGTFIRCWDVPRNKWVNRNLKKASDREFNDWIIRIGLCRGPANVWSVEERTEICRWLFDQNMLVTIVDYLERID